MATKLTKRFIDSAEASKPGLIFDSELPGFGIRVAQSGEKTFIVQYRAGSGRSAPKRRLTIGRYGVFTVDQARKAAQDHLHQAARGADPAQSKVARKTAPTVAVAGKDFLADVAVRLKPTTSREYARLWEAHVIPALGGARVADVVEAQVEALHRRLSDHRTQANRVLALLSSFFSFPEKRGLRPKRSNPASDIKAYPEAHRDRYLKEEEFAPLLRALERAYREGLPPAPRRRKTRKSGPTAKHRPKSADQPKPANPYAIAAILFLFATGMREKEALTLKWSDVDLERREARLRDTKTGRSVRPLGDDAINILLRLDRVAGSPYVFPGRTPDRPLVEINRVWYAVRHAAGLNDMRLHDLRHSFASELANTGSTLLVTGKALGHKNPATTARYAHIHDKTVHTAVDRASGRIMTLLSSNVLPFTPLLPPGSGGQAAPDEA